MPKHNKTGPLGQGPKTGWGRGLCAKGSGRGFYSPGRGLGWRRLWGCYPATASSKKEEMEILSRKAEILEEELKNIKSLQIELKGEK